MDWGISSKGWTAVDMSDSARLCAVSVQDEGRGDGLPRVLVAAAAPVEAAGDTKAALGALLPRTVRGLPAVVTLPRSQYSLRVVPEPAVPTREMTNSLRWTLTLDSDTPTDEINVAWMRIPVGEDLGARQRQLYAVTTPKAALATQQAAWRQAGLRPKAVDIQETALRNLAVRLEKPGEGLALMAADALGICIVFVYQGSLYLDRYIPQSAEEVRQTDGAGRKRFYERILQQLARSVDVVNRSYPFMQVSRVVVAPMPDRPGCGEWIATHAGVRVERLDLKALFDLQDVPDLAQSTTLQARCLVALGAALRQTRSAA